MNERIDLSQYDLKDMDSIYELVDEIEKNSQYNQKFVWCSRCNRKHQISSGVFLGHPIKPIPIKCESDEDHCWKWKNIRQIKIFGMNICNHDYYDNNGLLIMNRECIVMECMICGRKGLEELTFTGNKIDLTTAQLKEANDYIQTIRKIEFETLEKMNHKTFGDGSGGIIIQIPELDEKIREIQHIQDYYVIK